MRVNIGAPFSGMLLLYPKEGKNRAAGSTPIIRSHNSMTKLLIPLAFLTVAVPLFFIVRNYPGTLNSCETRGIQFMMRLMNFHMPTDAAIHTALEKGEAAGMELFHHVADQMAELARQLAKQGEVLQD